MYLKQNEVRETERINVSKMLVCRTPLLGKHIYECGKCGHTVEVPHSCKSRFCSPCGTIAIENWIAERFPALLDCGYHHVVVTLPAVFRYMIKMYRTEALNLFSQCVAESIKKWTKTRGYSPGMISFHHSFGSKLQFHPHFHFLVTAGGITKTGGWKNNYTEMPGDILMEIFKGKFSEGMRILLKSKLKDKSKQENHKHNNKIYKALHQIKSAFNSHWQYYTEAITKDSIYTMLYCARYVKKMIMSEKRIISYNRREQAVTFISGKGEVLVYDVMRFIKCIIQHIPEKHFRLVKYYGFYSAKSNKHYEIARKHWKPIQEEGEKLTWRLRQLIMNGRNPMRCPNCNLKMSIKNVIYPLKPVVRIKIEEILPIYGIAIQSKMQLDYG